MYEFFFRKTEIRQEVNDIEFHFIRFEILLRYVNNNNDSWMFDDATVNEDKKNFKSTDESR
jgi:hypothetical protein